MILRTKDLGNEVTRQDLYDLIYTSQAVSLTIPELATDVVRCAIVASSDPPSLSDGAVWWDMRQQLLRVFDSTYSYAFAVGPDRFESPAWAACPINKGAVVRIDPEATWSANGFDVGVPWVRPIDVSANGVHSWGVAMETTASGAMVPVGVGIVDAYFGYTMYNSMTGNKPITVASGVTGIVGAMSATPGVATHTWAIGWPIEERSANAGSNASCFMFINFIGPFKVRKWAT